MPYLGLLIASGIMVVQRKGQGEMFNDTTPTPTQANADMYCDQSSEPEAIRPELGERNPKP